MSMPALAQPTAAPSNGCRLVAADGRTLPLRGVEVDADAGGGLARVRLRQTFVNPWPEALRATYLLPLPADGAVVDFAFVIDGRRISGRVQKKADARAAFEQAVLEGRTAALLEQDRSSLFTQELGNLPPGATVLVEIDVEQPLAWHQGGWEWRWPTVVGPRYLGAGETPDAERVTVDVADRPLEIRCATRVLIHDALTGAPTSPSHPLQSGADAVTLGGSLDRDVVVRWPVAAPQPGVRLETARPAGDPDAYGLLTVVPPQLAGRPVPRDLCLLLDTSGSMSGKPLAQLQAFARALIGGLREGDRLEMIEFSMSPHRWKAQPVAVDARSRAEAIRWVDTLRAGGGTAMHEAVTEALRPLRAEAQRQVVLVTDGYIGFEAEVVGRIRKALPAGARLHTVGIGSAVNRTLTAGGARAGGGHEAVVGLDEPVDPVVEALLARTGDPLWVDLVVSGSAVRDHAPARIPDLLAGSPARIALRIAPEGGTLRIDARSAEGSFVQELRVEPVGPGRRVIATRYAREAVEDLEVARATGEAVDPQVEALGLKHAIATRLTSWIAETDTPMVDPSDPTRQQTIPHALPYGVSAEGVGLRSPAAVPAQSVAHTAVLAMPMAPPPPSGAPVTRAAAPGRADGLARPKAVVAEPEEAAAPRRRAEVERASEGAAKEKKAAPRKPGLFDRLFGGRSADEPSREEAEAPETVAPVAMEGPILTPAAPRVLTVRIRARSGGQLVLDGVVDADLDWTDADLWVVAADGTRTRVTALPGTTRSGRLSAGQTVRLVIAWTGADPVRIDASWLQLVIA